MPPLSAWTRDRALMTGADCSLWLTRPPWRAGLLSVTLVLCLGPLPARADDVMAASQAYSQAQEAELAEQFGRAAELFELANRIAPAAPALRSAVRARLSAGQLAQAAEGAEELLRVYPGDADSASLANEVLDQARPELGRLSVHCSEACSLVVDGLAATTHAAVNHVVYLSAGDHQLRAALADGNKVERILTLVAGATMTITLSSEPPPTLPDEPVPSDAPPAPPSVRVEPPAKKPSISPVVFYVSAATTAAVGGITLWSYWDLVSARDDYRATPTRAGFDDGEGKDTRTTVLGALTGALLATTGVLAFLTDWHDADHAEPTVSVIVTRQFASFSVSGRF